MMRRKEKKEQEQEERRKISHGPVGASSGTGPVRCARSGSRGNRGSGGGAGRSGGRGGGRAGSHGGGWGSPVVPVVPVEEAVVAPCGGLWEGNIGRSGGRSPSVAFLKLLTCLSLFLFLSFFLSFLLSFFVFLSSSFFYQFRLQFHFQFSLLSDADCWIGDIREPGAASAVISVILPLSLSPCFRVRFSRKISLGVVSHLADGAPTRQTQQTTQSKQQWNEPNESIPNSLNSDEKKLEESHFLDVFVPRHNWWPFHRIYNSEQQWNTHKKEKRKKKKNGGKLLDEMIRKEKRRKSEAWESPGLR